MKETYFTEENINAVADELLAHSTKYSKHKDWLPELASTALLVIDAQNYFFNPASNAYIPSSKPIFNYLLKLTRLFSLNKRPVIFTAHEYQNDNDRLFNKWWIKTGEPVAENVRVINELQDYCTTLIIKYNYDAFADTNLYEILIQNNIKDLIVTGVMTHLCCESTIRSAFDKNIRCFFPIDATADYNREFHLSSFINLSHGFCVPVKTQQIIDLFGEKYE